MAHGAGGDPTGPLLTAIEQRAQLWAVIERDQPAVEAEQGAAAANGIGQGRDLVDGDGLVDAPGDPPGRRERSGSSPGDSPRSAHRSVGTARGRIVAAFWPPWIKAGGCTCSAHSGRTTSR